MYCQIKSDSADPVQRRAPARERPPPRAERSACRIGRRFAGPAESCFSPAVGWDGRGLLEGGQLEAEARVFARYLLGRDPAPELLERYVAASRKLLRGPVDARDAALLGFVHRHPWSVSLLDAACGLLRPTGLLRSKLLIMAAILEASPAHAVDFLPRSPGTVVLLARLATLGTVAVGRVCAGLLLYLAAGRLRP